MVEWTAEITSVDREWAQVRTPLDAALFYACSLGWAVFPCNPDKDDKGRPKKAPLTKRGFREATTDRKAIVEYWTRWPDALIGFVPGNAGLYVIDLDKKDGLDGEKALLAGAGVAGVGRPCVGLGCLDTLHSNTVSGGRHLYFLRPKGEHFGNTKGGWEGAGIDVRCDAGYVILPAPGSGYEWVGDRHPWESKSLPAVPEWFLARLASTPKKKRSSSPRANDGTRPRSDASVEAVIRSVIAEIAAAPMGSRNDTINKSAYTLGGLIGAGALDEELARKALRGAVDAAGWDDLPGTYRKIDEGLRSGSQHPFAPDNRLSEKLTEVGNAHRLIHRHGADIRYVFMFRAWYIWTGVYWRRDDDGEIRRRAEETVEAIFHEAMEIGDADRRSAYLKWAIKSQSRNNISAMIELAQHQPGIALTPDDLDADPMLLGVLNGTIDLKHRGVS